MEMKYEQLREALSIMGECEDDGEDYIRFETHKEAILVFAVIGENEEGEWMGKSVVVTLWKDGKWTAEEMEEKR